MDKTHSRRAALGLAAGAALAGPSMAKEFVSKHSQGGQADRYPPPQVDRVFDHVINKPTPMSEEFNRLSNLARDARDIEERRIENKIAHLCRSRSTSQAYKDFMITKYRMERSALMERCQDYLDAIFKNFFPV